MVIVASIDLSGARDAANLLEEVVRRLATAHGDRYRELDRRISAFIEGETDPVPGPSIYVAGVLMMGAPKAVTDFIIEARSMGVIT